MSLSQKDKNKLYTRVIISIIALVSVIIFGILILDRLTEKQQQQYQQCQIECNAKGIGWSYCKFSLEIGCYCWEPKLLGIAGYDCVRIW